MRLLRMDDTSQTFVCSPPRSSSTEGRFLNTLGLCKHMWPSIHVQNTWMQALHSCRAPNPLRGTVNTTSPPINFAFQTWCLLKPSLPKPDCTSPECIHLQEKPMPVSLSLMQLQFGSIKGVCVFPMKRKVPCGKRGGQVSEEATPISISRLCFQKNNTQKIVLICAEHGSYP